MYAFGDSITGGGGSSNPGVLGYAYLIAAALGVGIVNRAVAGTTMNQPTTGILARMLGVRPPPRHDLVVTLVGQNDMDAWGEPGIPDFKTGLRTGLLHLTSARRVPEPRTEHERLLLRQNRLPSVAWGCSVWVGNTLKQVDGSYEGLGSSANQILYAAAVADVVAEVAAAGRRVHLVDTASAYDPVTQGSDPPSGLHPNDSGHASIANAFLAAMQAAAT